MERSDQDASLLKIWGCVACDRSSYSFRCHECVEFIVLILGRSTLMPLVADFTLGTGMALCIYWKTEYSSMKCPVAAVSAT